MSWDLFVQDLPEGVRSVAEIPDDFQPAAIGPRARIVDSIARVFPNVDFSDPTWGRVQTPSLSIEINIGPEEICQSFAIHVREGALAPFAIHELLVELGHRALDPSSATGLFSLREGSLDGLRKWQQYRDHVLADGI